ncbi:ferritin-like domain-containing protein [Actinomadura scrupuli]|uniref:ferritin-like domain-containing protein n=1 Tax=Actinomadura scrupuli TaxID=559629 RepID=UPI003D962747
MSESELAALTRELDDAHRETIPVMFARAHDLSEELADTSPRSPGTVSARRAFLVGAGGAFVTLALAACGNRARLVSATPESPVDSESPMESESPSASESASASPSASAGAYTGELKIVALAAALENQAAGAYQSVLSASQSGKLGKVPPAAATFAKTAMSQHTDHAKAWNAVLQSAGKPTITGTPLKNQQSLAEDLNKATDFGEAAKLALKLEDGATQTYVSVASKVANKRAIDIAASIAPVEAMHAAILHFMLGEYPVPDGTIGTDKAANPNDLTA